MNKLDIDAIEAVADELAAAPPEPDTANETRGEVDIVLNETRFVLRPSHHAMVQVENLTGKSCLALAMQATDGDLTLGNATIITTEFIKAWGRAIGDPVAANVDQDRIGELIHEYGLMRVVLRLAYVLRLAVTGGVKADGTTKEGEAMPATGAIATPGAGSQGSRAPRSAGRRASSGTPRRTSSGPRSSAGKK
jgi:hypothetical protein